MSFAEHLAKVVAEQLERFVTLNRHQLAGHVANLDFWLAQVRHALDVIDGYQERFRRLKAGQVEYVARHKTRVSSSLDPDVATVPDLPRRIPDGNLRDARRAVVDAAYRFLVRLCNDGLIPEEELRSRCSGLGIGFEASDLRRA
ncbi:hypothetical protein [Fimbriiglobus ruber]|uniref:Uncharacterized protein n=1 Tax=Fimbriiglobus ruber TaxID=1908690 RepID=A0A225DW54_9BACT|nr:hypothetical protein [Fimbriiglobus ruber]OWK45770.1 hypothetical protein FRUB_02101 [Fimbriiglobus ruber]